MRILPVLCIAAPLLACTSFPGTGGRSSSSSGGSTSAVTEAYRSFYDALCDYYERCASVSGPAYSSLAACKRAVDLGLRQGAKGLEDQDAIYTVDPAGLSSCTASLSTTACADRIPAAALACQDALYPRTPRNPGQGCSNQNVAGAPRCVQASRNRCNPDTAGNGCGTCAAKKNNGETCAIADECLSGYCNTLRLGPQCEDLPAAKGLGDGCLDTLECKGYLVCAGPLLNKRCSARAGAGQACSASRNGDTPECLVDLACINGTCALPIDDGQACTRSNGTAGCRGVCVFTAPDAAQGVCGSPPQLAGNGQPCMVHHTGGAAAPVCDSHGDLFADETTTGTPPVQAACTCRTRQAGGASCRNDGACMSTVCDGETSTAPGTCRAVGANGSTCTRDAECTSGFCATGSPRTCGTRATCP